MKFKLGRTGFLLGLAVLCLMLSQGLWGQSAAVNGTNTGCGYSLDQPVQPVAPQQKHRRSETELKSPQLVLVSDHSADDGENASIVGFWKIKFLLPDGTVFDDGYATWHSDGTELMNSGRPPMTGSFCMGAWKQNDDGSYKLNHFALSWDSTGTTLVGPAHIREQIRVDAGGKS